MTRQMEKSLIARGNTAEVYTWGEGEVLKLFFDWVSLEDAQHEARMASQVYEAGVPTPAVQNDVVEVDGRYGLVYERVVGTSMLSTFSARPWQFAKYANHLAELQVALHQHTFTNLPSQYETLKRKIQVAESLSDKLKANVLDLLETLPYDQNQLCHGDFHPDNVLSTADGFVIIDWIDATRGNPLTDVARSSILMSKGVIPMEPPGRWLVSAFRALFHRAYLRRYFRARPGDPTEFEQWQIVNAAARLSENVPEKEILVAFVKEKLEQH